MGAPIKHSTSPQIGWPRLCIHITLSLRLVLCEGEEEQGDISLCNPKIKAALVFHSEKSSACQCQPPSRLPTAGSPQVFI